MLITGQRARAMCVGGVLLALGASPGLAQPTKSAPAAVELMTLLSQAGQDAVAAPLPEGENRFAAALLLGGAQLLVVSGEYTAPDLLTPTLDEKQYRDVYVELQGASVPETKVFVTDLGADGLISRPVEGQPFDSYEAAGTRTAFDGKWRDQSLSEEEYMTRFTEADAQYAAMLTALVDALK